MRNGVMTNEDCLTALTRDYPQADWSRTVTDHGEPGELVVTFQRYRDDAEDRYVIRDGRAEQV